MSSVSSQENVHGGVHFWKSYRHYCFQLFKKELHYSHLFFSFFFLSCSWKYTPAFPMDKRFPAMWLVPLKCGNATMYSYDFILQKLWNKINLKSCVHLLVHFKENVCKKKFISAEVIEYFLQPFEKRIPQ